MLPLHLVVVGTVVVVMIGPAKGTLYDVSTLRDTVVATTAWGGRKTMLDCSLVAGDNCVIRRLIGVNDVSTPDKCLQQRAVDEVRCEVCMKETCPLSILLQSPIASAKDTVNVFWNSSTIVVVAFAFCSVSPVELNVHKMHLLCLPDVIRRLTRGVESFGALSTRSIFVEQVSPRIFSKSLQHVNHFKLSVRIIDRALLCPA